MGKAWLREIWIATEKQYTSSSGGIAELKKKQKNIGFMNVWSHSPTLIINELFWYEAFLQRMLLSSES